MPDLRITWRDRLRSLLGQIHMMRLLSLTLMLVNGLAVAGPVEVAHAARVEGFLRAQGLTPGAPAPGLDFDGGLAMVVHGTADTPRLVEAACIPSEPVQPALKGQRFVYESHNRGEWGGRLTVREQGGKKRTLLEENIIALIPSGPDLYVFSGLDHTWSDDGGVHVVENYDSRPSFRSISRLPGTPLAIGPASDHRGDFLVVSRLSLTRIHGRSIEVLMARHAPLYTANSILAFGRSQILVGLCGGIAQVQLPWYLRPPDTGYEIPVVTYWERSK